MHIVNVIKPILDLFSTTGFKNIPNTLTDLENKLTERGRRQGKRMGGRDSLGVWDGLFHCCSVAQSCPAICDPWTTAHQASLSFTNSQSLPKLMSIKSVMPSHHLILCRPLLLLRSIFPSIRVSPMSQLFASGGQRTGVSASACTHCCI